MDSNSLSAEVAAGAQNVRRAHFDKLEKLGVPPLAIGKIGQRHQSIGIMKIRPLQDGLYQPDESGFAACLVAICDPSAFGHSGVYDIAAFRSDDPARWWCRTGLAFALGEHLLDLPDPVRVVRSPVDWLATAGHSLCILDWSDASPAWRELRSGPPLTFKDDALHQQVRKALVRSAPMPTMEIAA